MIELTTGVPGAGKTLSMVYRLHKLQQKWLQHPEETRPVFVSGIPDLALPHLPLPVKSVQLARSLTPQIVPAWEELPEGALVLISEAQGFFPPRSSQTTAPEHVAFLNVHRHKGLDIWLDTQHPKLIDMGVRALVGKHQHYRRLFGGQRAVVYEWDSCSDSLSGTANATKSYWSYPKNAYKFYKSAEVHTKQQFKLPWWVFVPFIGIAGMIYSMPKAYSVLSSGVQQKEGEIKRSVQDKPKEKEKEPLKLGVPVVSAAPLQISACVASATRCQCYSHTGIRLKLADEECRQAAESPNQFFRLEEQRDGMPQSRPVVAQLAQVGD